MKQQTDNQYINASNCPAEELSTEERILQAAQQEFMRKGYAGARTTAIAEAAGVTHAMLHYYFRTKENLFSRMVVEKIDMLSQALTISLGNDDEPFAESLTGAITTHFKFLRANPELPHFIVAEVFYNQELLQIIKDKFIRVIAGIVARLQQKIDAAVARGECRPLAARDLLFDIVALNIFPILGMPVVENMLGFFPGINDIDKLLDWRLNNTIDTILRKIKP